MIRRLSIVLVVALVAGCATYGAVAPEERRSIGDAYSVDPQITWSRSKKGKLETWTVDGPRLETLEFAIGLAEGDPLYRIRGRDDLPVYRKTMSETEIMEFVVDSFVAAGAHSVEPANLRPAPFGPWPGFRFDISFQRARGLDWLGMALGARKDDKLYLILYTGARLHYFGKHKDTVEALFASIET